MASSDAKHSPDSECCEGAFEAVDIMSGLLNNNLQKVIKDKRTLWGIRMVVGVILNITEFIVVCQVNKDSFLADRASKGLFGFIVVYLVICAGATCVFTMKMGERTARLYKIVDAIFDIYLMVYSFVIAEDMDSFFPIACSIFTGIDILLCFLSVGFGKFKNLDKPTENVDNSQPAFTTPAYPSNQQVSTVANQYRPSGYQPNGI